MPSDRSKSLNDGDDDLNVAKNHHQSIASPPPSSSSTPLLQSNETTSKSIGKMKTPSSTSSSSNRQSISVPDVNVAVDAKKPKLSSSKSGKGGSVNQMDQIRPSQQPPPQPQSIITIDLPEESNDSQTIPMMTFSRADYNNETPSVPPPSPSPVVIVAASSAAAGLPLKNTEESQQSNLNDQQQRQIPSSPATFPVPPSPAAAAASISKSSTKIKPVITTPISIASTPLASNLKSSPPILLPPPPPPPPTTTAIPSLPVVPTTDNPTTTTTTTTTTPRKPSVVFQDPPPSHNHHNQHQHHSTAKHHHNHHQHSGKQKMKHSRTSRESNVSISSPPVSSPPPGPASNTFQQPQGTSPAIIMEKSSSTSTITSSSNRTLSLSDTDLCYMTLPADVKMNSTPLQESLPQDKLTNSTAMASTTTTSTTTTMVKTPPQSNNVTIQSVQFESINHQQQQNYQNTVHGFPHGNNNNRATILADRSDRSIRFDQNQLQQQQRMPSKSMRTLPVHASTRRSHPIGAGGGGTQYQSTYLTKSRISLRRMRSTNFSQIRLPLSSQTETYVGDDNNFDDLSDQELLTANNYLDNTNTSDNEAVQILPIEARELLLQEEEDRKSRLAKQSTSLLKITPNYGQRRESKFFPGRIRKRVILKNGNINLCPEHVDKRGRRYLQDTFTTMVDIRWRWNLLVFAMGFLISWFGFSIVWWLIAFSHSDFEHLNDDEWIPCVQSLRNFPSALLFSIETQHTIGYGSRYTTDECPEAIFVMMLQSITGVMIQCFMVGFVFAKLSRPQKRSQTLMFSRYAIVNTRDNRLCLMFRVGDLRDRSHIIGCKISAQVIKKRITKEGEIIPYFHQKLNVRFDDLDDEVFLIWPAIIVHDIDKDSPFYKMNVDDMMKEKFEIIAILEGTVESTGQTVQARTSYLPSEILWGHRFEQLIRYRHDTGEYLVDYSKFNNTFEVDTPWCSAKELEEDLKQQQQEEQDEEDEDGEGGTGSNSSDDEESRNRRLQLRR